MKKIDWLKLPQDLRPYDEVSRCERFIVRNKPQLKCPQGPDLLIPGGPRINDKGDDQGPIAGTIPDYRMTGRYAWQEGLVFSHMLSFNCCGAGTMRNMDLMVENERQKALILFYFRQVSAERRMFFILSGSQVRDRNKRISGFFIDECGAKQFGEQFENKTHASSGLFMYSLQWGDIPEKIKNKYLTVYTNNEFRKTPKWYPTFVLEAYGALGEKKEEPFPTVLPSQLKPVHIQGTFHVNDLFIEQPVRKPLRDKNGRFVSKATKGAI